MRHPKSSFLIRVPKIVIARLLCLLSFAGCGGVHAQLVATVAEPKLVGQKAVLPLHLKNNFSTKVESARAVVFLLDEKGKIISQSTKWVIGGTKDQPPLESNKEAVFNFVLTSARAIDTTNARLRVNFTRIVLEGGKLADPTKDVVIGKPAN